MPKRFTVAEAMSIVRDKLKLRKEQGIVLLANGKYMLKQTAFLVDIYEQYKDQDGFLYLVYTEENIYG